MISSASRTETKFLALPLISIVCSGFTRALGTFSRLPSSSTWPWLTSWRAWRVVSAKPSRRTTVSSRVSSERIISSPVTLRERDAWS